MPGKPYTAWSVWPARLCGLHPLTLQPEEEKRNWAKRFTVACFTNPSVKGAHLQYEVGDEGIGLILRQVVVLSVQHGKQQLQILQYLHQHCGVGVKEAQSEPLQNEVQAADGGFTLTLQPLSNKNTYSMHILLPAETGPVQKHDTVQDQALPQSWLLWPWRVSGSQSGRAHPAAT